MNIWTKKLESKIPKLGKRISVGVYLLNKWFCPSRELFTQVVYKASEKAKKPQLETLEAFINVITKILQRVDKNGYRSGVKQLLQDHIKYAPTKLKEFQNKQAGGNEDQADGNQNIK